MTTRIDAGNRAPTALIETPVGGTLGAVGEGFVLRGSATDPEDGALPVSALRWEVLRHYATHTHPFLDPTVGNNIAITYPEPEDLDAAQTSYLEIRLTATDSGGLSHTVARQLLPKKVNIHFQTNPAGLALHVSGTTVSGPSMVVSWEGLALHVDAPHQTDAGGQAWEWDAWSDGGAQTHTVVTSAAPLTLSATFKPGGAASTQTFVPVADAYVSSAETSRNFGTSSTLRTDASPILRSYLRFDVRDIGVPIAKAVLRIYPNSSNSIGYQVHGVADNTRGERTITYGNAPAPASAVTASSGRVTAGAWTEVDITPLITGNGLVSVTLSSTSTTATTYASREGGGNAPQLVITSGSGQVDGEPPSTPQGLIATAASSSQVNLSWGPAMDNTAVAGYTVFRNGAQLAVLNASTQAYEDRTVTPATQYSYTVDAFDHAGNHSPPSTAASVTTPGAGSTSVTVGAEADAYVDGGNATTNYGAATQLRVDGGSTPEEAYFRFTLAGVSGTVQRAKLRIFASASTVDGPTASLAENSWSESTITWNNRPARSRGILADTAAIKSNSFVEIDVTTAVVGNGTYTFVLQPTSTDSVSFHSREGANQPQLIVEFAP